MTLRERIENTKRLMQCGIDGGGLPLGVRIYAEDAVCELDKALTETADADAEQSRLARIGELVEGLVALYDVGLSVNDHGATVWLTPDGMGGSEQANRPTLLDALEALRAKTEGGVMADGKAARCDACGHIFDRDERRYSDFWYDQSDEGRIVAVCGPCQGVFPPKSCPSCATLRAELDTVRGKLRELEDRICGAIGLPDEETFIRTGLHTDTVLGNFDGILTVRNWLRELGLVEARDE